jgi:hypothetical protein
MAKLKSIPEQRALDTGRSEPLTPPKKPNAFKRFFSKIF